MRQKHVYPTSEIAHLWAHQTQSSARNQQGNFYFEGKIIYSYGSHFPIAKILDSDTVFMTTRSYSNSTAKHINNVRYSLHFETVFNVPNVEPYNKTDHVKNVRCYIGEIRTAIDKQSRARIANYLPEITSNLKELKKYVIRFKLKSRLTSIEKDLLNLEPESLLNRSSLFTDNAIKLIKLAKRKEAKKKKDRIIYEKKQLKKWLVGENVQSYFTDVFLRVKDDQVQTSQGATVPIKEAKILFYRLKQGKDVKGFKIGYYTVISTNGVLKIGCHEIKQNEINRFAKTQNWE